MTEPTMLIVSPAYKVPGVPGSVRIKASCGHDAWLAPSGQRSQRLDPLPTRCVDCMPSGPFEARVVEGSREELAAQMGPFASDFVIEAVKAFGLNREGDAPWS